MAAGGHLGFNRAGNSAIRSADPGNPIPITKREVDRMTHRGDMAIRNSTSREVHNGERDILWGSASQ